MRPLLIVLAGACASLGTSLAVFVAIQLDEKPYVEVLKGGLLRTSASEADLNNAVSRVLQVTRRPAKTEEQRLKQSEYCEHADAWFSQPDLFGHSSEEVSRLVRQQIDRQGRPMRIEVLKADDMATLVFIEHEDNEAATRIARQIAGELTESGVQAR